VGISREPSWIEATAGGAICRLCPHACAWTPVRPLGLCRVRGLQGGRPGLPGWGRCVSTALDPIEKKPLFHFLPGASILSTGPAGCNLSCSFCQNWSISQQESPTRLVMPRDLAAMALSDGSSGLAFTYTEPTIWFEYIAETAPLVRSMGGVVVMVSNGYVNPAPMKAYLEITDAWNIDLKGWSRDFYREVCGGERDVVLSSIVAVAASQAHLEITYLMIPGRNDDPADWVSMASWVADNAGSEVPFHISRYFPRYRMEAPPTPPETILRAVEVFSSKLRFVYPGNLPGDAPTICPGCGAEAVRRSGWRVDASGLGRGGVCRSCGAGLGIVTEPPASR